MTAVCCFSGSGHSGAVAGFLCERLGCALLPIGKTSPDTGTPCATAVVVFPVYCQAIPEPVKDFLGCLDAKRIVLIATYGGISHGNVLHEAAKRVSGTVIAGAYVPTGHTFLGEGPAFDADALLPVVERIRHPLAAVIPKTPKHVFAGFFPAWRSRVGVKIRRSGACTSCNTCGDNCPTGAIRNGRIRGNCIRCLRCVSHCPVGALTFHNSAILTSYLKRYASRRMDGVEVYL